MKSINIESLTLTVTGTAAGHETRVGALTRLALDLVADRLAMPSAAVDNIDRLSIDAGPLRLDVLTDEAAAEQIAGAILDAVALKLSV